MLTQLLVDRSQVLALTQEDWVGRPLNAIITSPTSTGKSYLAFARADGAWPKFLETPAKTQLLIIDDWLRYPLNESQTPDLLETFEDRYGQTSTLLATQIPVADWHDRLGKPSLSEAVMDRLIHNAYRLDLEGESMRKRRSPLTHSGHKEIL